MLQVFKTDWKGFGLRAMVPLPSGTFLMEYVGEVSRSTITLSFSTWH